MATYKHPLNGHRVKVGSLGPFLGALVFGALYFLYKGSVKHFFLYILLAPLTLGLSMLLYPFKARAILERMYLEKGYKREGAEEGTRIFGLRLW